MTTEKTSSDMGDECTAAKPAPEHRTDAFDALSEVVELALDRARAEWAQASELAAGSNLGDYQIIRRIGQGGMGTVYLAQHPRQPEPVALKVLSREFSMRGDAVRRFHKEATSLARIQSPHVIRLVETGEIDGVNFIASEFIDGGDAGKHVALHGAFSPEQSLLVFRHIATALDAMHRAGMIHRDIKPENILLELAPQLPSPAAAQAVPEIVSAKLSDFGLARMLDQSESMAITRTMAIMGTPRFMSPEQFQGARDVEAGSDIYSLGATIYFLAVGQHLFDGEDMVELAQQHRSAGFRPAHQVNRSLAPAFGRILARCLEKLPENRYPSAAELLDDLQRLESGRPTGATGAMLVSVPDEKNAVTRQFEWEIGLAAATLWPHVSHTDRINRAIGLPAATFQDDRESGSGDVLLAQARLAGLTLRWREHSFVWIENREMTVFREFDSGPYRWLVNHVELQPLASGGTRLVHRLEFLPRSFLGRLLSRIQIDWMTHRKLDSVYRRIESRLKAAGQADGVNAIERPVKRTSRQQTAFALAADRLASRKTEPGLVARFDEFLSSGFDAEVARIRPRALAARIDEDERTVLTALVHGIQAGMFLMYWDVICPRCRVAAEIIDTLEQIRRHGHCKVCRADFEVDLASSVELIFRVHPEIRETDLRTWCVGGPFHAPHVIAQLQLLPGQRRSLELTLTPGEYQVTGPQLPHSMTLLVDSASTEFAATFTTTSPLRISRLGNGRQVLTLINNSDSTTRIRVERSSGIGLAVTAAMALRNELIRQYLPGQMVAPEQLVSVSDCCVLQVRLGGRQDLFSVLGEQAAVETSRRFLVLLRETVRSCNGDVVHSFADGFTACFVKAESTLACAASLHQQWQRANPDFSRVRVVLHRGQVSMSSLDGQPHHTGRVFSSAARLCHSEQVLPADWDGVALTDSFRNSLGENRELPLSELEIRCGTEADREKLWLLNLVRSGIDEPGT